MIVIDSSLPMPLSMAPLNPSAPLFLPAPHHFFPPPPPPPFHPYCSHLFLTNNSYYPPPPPSLPPLPFGVSSSPDLVQPNSCYPSPPLPFFPCYTWPGYPVYPAPPTKKAFAVDEFALPTSPFSDLVEEPPQVVLAAEEGPEKKKKNDKGSKDGVQAWKKPKSYWRAKDQKETRPPLPRLPVDLLEDCEFKEEEALGGGDGGKTTVMIKNLPNRFTKNRVLEMLDDHCLRVNRDLDVGAAKSEFDFLYLPMDFRTGSNLGYCFVNFTNTIGALRLYRELHRRSWTLLGSRKTCAVTYARIQGLPELLRHFRSSVFFCETYEYLPVHFRPNRDGVRLTDQHFIGKHVPRSKT